MTFISGYLGAGKTTLINEFLARTDRPVAVLVNDVGEVNIDARLIKKRSADTIELTDGCVCCSLSEGFGFALDQLRALESPPDHVVVELSGLALPDRVLPWGRSAGFVLDGVVTLVDVEQFAERMHGAAATIVSQIQTADVVLLTKADLAPSATVDAARHTIEGLSPGVAIIVGDRETAAGLLQLGARRPAGITDMPEPTLFDEHRVRSEPLANPITRDDLQLVVDALSADVVRAKGIARDPDGVLWLVQVVGRRRSITRLPAAESAEPTSLVVISFPTAGM
jgi:G3E family GTPase